MAETMAHPITIYHHGQPLARIFFPPANRSSPAPTQITVEPGLLPSIPSSPTPSPPNQSYFWQILVGLIVFLALATAIVVPIVVLVVYGAVDSSTSTTTKTTTSSATSTTGTTTTSQTTTSTSATSTTTSATTTTTTTGTSIVYSQSLSSGVTPSSQCSAWTTFQSLLVARPYSFLTLSGSNDPIGITLTNGTVVAAIANALRTNTAFSAVSSNGYSWAVGTCGSGLELTATGGICGCSTGYTVRPCIGNSNWGGINSATCSAATQTLIVTFQ